MSGHPYVEAEPNTPAPERAGPPDIAELMAYENGDLDVDATVKLFQRLVDCGMAWTLQGHYGRTARALIEGGYVHV